MRRRLVVTALAIAATITLTFGIPLGVVVHRVAADRAMSAAEAEARSLINALASISDRATLASIVAAFQSDDRSVTVYLADGTILGVAETASSSVEVARRGRSFTASEDGGRAVYVPVVHVDGSVDVARVFVPRHELERGVVASWLLLGGLGMLLMAVGVLLADRLGRTVVRPIGELAGVAGRLAHGDLDARAALEGPAEVVEVASAMNVLAGRIDELLAAERESVADLSHRLRTPLAVLRLEAENLPRNEAAGAVIAATDEMARAVDRLIDEARRPLRRAAGTTCDAAALVRDRAAFWAPLAEDEGRVWSVDAPDTALPASCPGDDLAAALDALIGNVLAHTPAGTAFRLEARNSGGRLEVVVADEGPGIADPSLLERGASGGGSTGLGLDIARRTAESCGGSLRVGRRDANQGTEIVLDLGPLDS